MTASPGLSPAAQRVVRLLALISGTVLAALGGLLLVVFRPLEARLPDFSFNASLLLGIGLLLMLAGLLGAQWGTWYRRAAVLLLNTLLLLAVLQLLAFFTGFFRQAVSTDAVLPFSQLPYYVEQPWTDQYLNDTLQMQQVQRSYLLWTYTPLTTSTINQTADQGRLVPGAQCDAPDALVVWMLGGSALWSVGATDALSIPAFVQAELDQALEQPVCVVNLGIPGYVFTQELFSLIQRLQRGQRPDLVVFYNGANDSHYALTTNLPGSHAGLRAFMQQVNSDPLATAIGRLALVRFWQPPSGYLGSERPDYVPPLDVDTLGAQVLDVYAQTVRVAQGIGEEYGFSTYVFWQPLLAASAKPLSTYEQRLLDTTAPEILAVVRLIQPQLAAHLADQPQFTDLTDTFDDQSETFFYDTVHTIPPGNQRVAARIAARLLADQQGD